MIAVTGDMHGDTNRLINTMHGLNKNDYLLVAGDFGFIYNGDENENKLLNCLQEKLTQKQVILLFVDGNHENFTEIYKYPADIWNGGKIHKIRDNIFHLMRGQVFDIDGLSFFTFGGAYSVDRYMRHLGTSWWNEEVASDAEIKEAWDNLKMHNYEVDYIISHQVPGYLQNKLVNGNDNYDNKDEKDNHMHQDILLSEQVQVLYFGLEKLCGRV